MKNSKNFLCQSLHYLSATVNFKDTNILGRFNIAFYLIMLHEQLMVVYLPYTTVTIKSKVCD